MTMPDACSQRIERMLHRKLGEKQGEQVVRVSPGTSRRQWWGIAAALVCLVLVITMGGTFLFLNVAEGNRGKPLATATHVTTAPGPTVGTDAKEYSQDGLSFRYPGTWQLELADEMEQFYENGVLRLMLVRREAWEAATELDAEGYQAMLRRSGYADAVVTELSQVRVGGADANRVVFTDVDRTITRYDVAAGDAGYSFCFADYIQNAPADPQQERALLDSVRFDAVEESGDFSLSDEGRAFLEKMCDYMPDWVGYASLDDHFWYCFLHDSFTCPELGEDGKAVTVAGEAAYSDGVVKIRREAVERYVKLAMGCELPSLALEYDELEPELNILYYEDGFYYVAVSDFGSVGYTFREWEVHQEAYETYAFAIFDVYVDEPDSVLGTVTFTLYPAENENGFTIISKQTQELESPSAGDVVWAFAQAYFWGSREDLLPYLADSFSGRAEVYGGGTVTLNRTNVAGMGYAEVGTGLNASVEFQAAGEDSLSYLSVDLIRQEDGWRVQGYGLEK